MTVKGTNLKRTIHFQVQRFKPSGKFNEKIDCHIEVSLIDNGKMIQIYMNDVVDYLREVFNLYPGWSFYTTHDLGYPVLVTIPGEPEE